jgi:methionyl-tRNA synthetase
MIAKNCGGRVPEPGGGLARAERTKEDHALLEAGEGLLVRLRAAMDVQAFHEAIEALWVVIRAANAYVDHQAPWKLAKENPSRMATVLYVLAETVRKLALLTQPLMPESSSKLLDQLAVGPDARTFEALAPGRELKPGTALPPPQGVFPRFVESEGKGAR